ncbi:hypothetical protein VVR85_07185 [Corynebacterium sp. LK2590]|uniref:hypothetical protein n=1 Tax=unclassified Corynebacterium TaxID=2624378 RepID=UPI0034CF1BBA
MTSRISFHPHTWTKRSLVVHTDLPGPPEWGPEKLWRRLPARAQRPVRVSFTFNRDVAVTGDCLALALSTLTGKNFERIDFGFEVSAGVREAIAEWTQAEVNAEGAPGGAGTAPGGVTEAIAGKAVLNFSGGFDSLAARYLLPEDHELVSLDFGGRFSREREFFQRFDPIRVETNVVRTPLRANSWSFIGLGTLLTAATTRAEYCSFGSILESTRFKRGSAYENNFTFPPFAAAGMTNAAPTLGLTEAGTVLVLAHNAPELLADSLQSLAGPREEKLVRKRALVEAVLAAAGTPVRLPRIEMPPEPYFTFGDNFTTDLTAMYLSWLGHPDLARQLVRGFSQQIVRDVRGMDFDFMRKADGRIYRNYPEPLRATLTAGLDKAGIEYYSAQDEEANAEFLRYWQAFKAKQAG